MRNEEINKAKHIARETVFNVQACYCGHRVPDAEMERYEDDAEELIKNATDEEIEAAFDECVECGMDENEVEAVNILKVIGDKAPTAYETVTVEYVHVVREK